MTNPWKTLSIWLIISLQLMENVRGQLDDEVSFRKVQLQDLDIEQNERGFQRDEFKRLQQQQLPFPSDEYSSIGSEQINPSTHTFYGREGSNRNPSAQISAQYIKPQSVRPLEQPITAAKRIRPTDVDYATVAASNFNFGINPLIHNDLPGEPTEGDIDSDIVKFSHDEPPLPIHLRRPQLEILNGGGAGYALTSADVLLPPFHDDGAGSFLQSQKIRPSHLSHLPLDIGKGTLQHQHNDWMNRPEAGSFDISNGYLPMNKFASHNQPIQYGSPQASFRRPSIYPQSNQLAFSPQRPKGATLTTSPQKIPYPPSFVTLTTQRPETDYIPMAVRPLGRSLGYKSQFRPSAIDPVPDFFANRQPKSLLDSYIPSWVVAKMLEEQRSNVFDRSNFFDYNDGFQNSRLLQRSFVEPNWPQHRTDEINLQRTIDNEENNFNKIVKKSLDKQLLTSFEDTMKMTV